MYWQTGLGLPRKQKKHGEFIYAKYDLNGKIIREKRNNNKIFSGKDLSKIVTKSQLPSLTSSSSCNILPNNNTLVSSTGVQRRFREFLKRNKAFDILNSNVKKVDSSDFIVPEMIFEIINKYCFPLSLDDFRIVISNLKKNNLNYVSWSNFQDLYDPSKVIQEELKLKKIDKFISKALINKSTSLVNIIKK